MIQFTSKAGGAVALLDADGRHLLQALGKEAQAARGVITPEQLPVAIAALEAAAQAQQSAHQAAVLAAEERAGRGAASAEDERHGPPVSLAQRAYPLLQLLRAAHAAGEPVLWGV